MSIIDPHSAATAIGLVNSAFSSVKTALDLAKKTTDLDLKQEVSNVFDNVLELKATVYELAEENRNLRLRLEQKENISYFPQTGFFFKENESLPLCPKCYQSQDHAVVYLHRWNDGSHHCHVCGKNYY